jgi:hypothetical protein
MAFPGTNEFMMTDQTNYYYDQNGTPTFENVYNFEIFTQSLLPVWRTEYSFNEKGMQYVSYDYNYNEALADPWELVSKDSTVFADGEKPLIDLNYELLYEENKLLVREKTFYSYATPNKIFENSINNLVKVFPNPAYNSFNLSIKNPQNASVKLYNLSGQLMLQQNITSENTQISTENLQPGNYLIKTINNSNTNAQLIIIK